MNAPQQFDMFGAADAGVMLRDIGMVEAEFAEVLSGSDYTAALYAAICHVARRQIEVHIDDVLAMVKTQPLHFNSAGATWLRAIKDGAIIKTNKTRPCRSDRHKHLHEYRVYRSGIFHRRRG